MKKNMMMMKMMTSEEIGTLALESMLAEVSATPKPGLVDRNNSGAHRDMSFFTFIRSAASLKDSFNEFAETGFANQNLTPSEIFPLIRKIGIKAEEKMFKATDGINTHKGEIFSLGIMCACSGYLTGKYEKFSAEDVLKVSSEMCSGICERDFAKIKTKSQNLLTKGERVYIEYGITGIRGEAEKGYPVVKNISLPALKKYLSQGLNINDSLSMTLIHIMAYASDTNIISRRDLKTAEKVVEIARNFLSENYGLNEIYELDEKFINENISPGGSGDLLAVTYFLWKLEKFFAC